MSEYVPVLCTEEFNVEALYTVHYFEYASDYRYPGEQHNFWEFCYVDKGELEVLAGEQWLVLKKGQMVFHKPGEFHSLQANGKIAPNLVVASFGCHAPQMGWFEHRIVTVTAQQRGFLASILEEASSAFLSPLNDPELKQLLRSASALPGAEQMIKITLEALLISLYRSGMEGEPSPQGAPSLLRERAGQQQLEAILLYFEQNICRQLTLQQICKDNLIGRSALQKMFREKTGGGAMEYFANMKIEAAKQCIREGGENFTQLAFHLGYSTIHYFSRHFKKATGMTLSEYASSVKVLTARSRLE